jgi:hypothetical protein
MPRFVIPSGQAPISIPSAGVTLVVINDAVGQLLHASTLPILSRVQQCRGTQGFPQRVTCPRRRADERALRQLNKKLGTPSSLAILSSCSRTSVILMAAPRKSYRPLAELVLVRARVSHSGSEQQTLLLASNLGSVQEINIRERVKLANRVLDNKEIDTIQIIRDQWHDLHPARSQGRRRSAKMPT